MYILPPFLFGCFYLRCKSKRKEKEAAPPEPLHTTFNRKDSVFCTIKFKIILFSKLFPIPWTSRPQCPNKTRKAYKGPRGRCTDAGSSSQRRGRRRGIRFMFIVYSAHSICYACLPCTEYRAGDISLDTERGHVANFCFCFWFSFLFLSPIPMSSCLLLPLPRIPDPCSPAKHLPPLCDEKDWSGRGNKTWTKQMVETAFLQPRIPCALCIKSSAGCIVLKVFQTLKVGHPAAWVGRGSRAQSGRGLKRRYYVQDCQCTHDHKAESFNGQEPNGWWPLNVCLHEHFFFLIKWRWSQLERVLALIFTKRGHASRNNLKYQARGTIVRPRERCKLFNYLSKLCFVVG